MKEEEAKKKWCPMSRQDNDDAGTWNRVWSRLKQWFPDDAGGVVSHDICNCIASDCMMWRGDIPDTNGDPVTTHGHCGLAGKP